MILTQSIRLPFRSPVAGCSPAPEQWLRLAPRAADAVLQLDITQGNVQPMPIALPDFISETDIGRNVTAVISNNLQRSGSVRADQSGRLHRKNHQQR